MSDQCLSCDAVVDYEINDASCCRSCGERLLRPIPVPEGVERLVFSCGEGIPIIDASIKRVWELLGC